MGKDNQYFYVHLFWGKCPLGHIGPPPPLQIITQLHYTLHNHYKLHFFFHFRYTLLQISHQKCFFISISILGRSGALLYLALYAIWIMLRRHFYCSQGNLK